MTDRRTHVQGDHKRPPGTIAWAEHEAIWREYSKQFGTEQSAERIAERHGFGHSEAVMLLGRELRTWRVGKEGESDD